MKSKYFLYKSAAVAALSGFLFGFDTVVISGAEQTIQQLWGLNSTMHGLAISMALWGTVIGALFGAIPTEHLGRKKTLILVGVLYFISAIGSALALDVYSFIVFRFIGGLGIGISTIVAPIYIAEISPPDKRGRLTGLFQFNIVFGILVAYISNAFLANSMVHSWRWMLGIETLPAIIFLLLCFSLAESPRWLITRKNDTANAKKIFSWINPGLDNDTIVQMVNSVTLSANNEKVKTNFFSKRLLKPILLAFFIAFFNQLSGINAILYFAPRIFEMTGLGEQSALLQSIGIGVVNLVFTLIGLQLIDKIGRKTLLSIGCLGYVISLGTCAWAFYAGYESIVPYCIFAFIAAHAIGQGAVIWVFISEIFPNKFRDSGQAFGSFTHWFFAASLTLLFPIMVERFSPALIFGFFCAMMVLQGIWIKFYVPETKGTSLEEIDAQLGS